MKAFRAAILSLLLAATAFGQFVEPTLPQATVDTTLPTGWNGTADATPADSAALVQALLDIDQNTGTSPYIIELTAGATYTGTFKVPNKTGTDWIIIRSSAYASLPATGTRVTPADASNMAKLSNTTAGVANLWFEHAAHNVRLIGIEITNTNSVASGTLVDIGHDVVTDQYSPTLGDMPTNIILDRVYIHGQPTAEFRRGIGLHGAYCAVIDSDIREFHNNGGDAQAIAGWAGPGPYLIHNNFIQGAAENVIFGGADPVITNLVPSDITFTNNHVFKPLTWKIDDPSYAGIPWTVKNIFELKNSRRVLIDGNVFENCWPHAQAGYAILLTPRNSSGAATWSTVEDTTFRNNWIKNTFSGIQLLSSDDQPWGSLPIKRMAIDNNLILCEQGGESKPVQFSAYTPTAESIAFRHNTMLFLSPGGATFVFGDSGTCCDQFIWKDNLASHGTYGMYSPSGSGTTGLNAFMDNYVFTHNVFMVPGLVDGNDYFSAQYTGNFFAATVAAVQFTNYAGGDYSLAPGSPYAGAASDTEDIGVDWAALQAAIDGVVEGTPDESPLRLYINSAAGLLPIEVAE